MKSKMTLGLVMTAILTTLLWAGDLNPSAPPTTGTMKPLDEVEPRTVIPSLPYSITQSGSYYLTANLTSASSGITVYTDNVTIDLNGYTITGPGTGTSNGIYMTNRSNVEIRNGTVQGFYHGIYETSTSGEGHRVFGMRVRDNLNAGIYLAGSNCQIRDNTVSSNGASAANAVVYGIYSGSGGTVANNAVTRTGHQATATSHIYGIQTSNGCTVTGNTVYYNGTSAAGHVYGLSVSNGCILAGNNVNNNGTSTTIGLVYGIDVDGHGNTISGNTTYNNGVLAAESVFGINTSTGNIISGNTSYYNGSSCGGSVRGINAGASSTVTGNTAYQNGISAAGIVYGIYLGGSNLVNNNTSHGNNGTNMNAPASCVFGTNVAP